jgi:hypothetical protein
MAIKVLFTRRESMCQQCVTEATGFKKRPFKGWFLVRATKPDIDSDGFGPAIGDWGIGVCNDPYFWIDGTPAPDPTYGMTKEQEEVYYDNLTDEQKEANSRFDDWMENVAEALVGEVVYGYLLGKACVDSGWNDKKGLTKFVAHHIWMASQSEQWPHDMPAVLNAQGEAVPLEHED